MGIDLGAQHVPDETTVLKFRHLLDRHDLGKRLFAEVGQVLQASGFQIKTGTIVDATLVGAPSSTKNADKARDPEMYQTLKGRQWYFGMKLHIGVDSQSGLAHSAVVTAANVHDKHPLPDLLHGNERRVHGDSAYASQKALIQGKAPNALDFTNQRTRKAGCEVDEVKKAKNRNKSKIRARGRACLRGGQGITRLPQGGRAAHPVGHRRAWGGALVTGHRGRSGVAGFSAAIVAAAVLGGVRIASQLLRVAALRG